MHKKLIPRKQIGGLLKGYNAPSVGSIGGNAGAMTGLKTPKGMGNNVALGGASKTPNATGASGASKMAGGMGMAMNAIGTAGQAIGKFSAISNSGMTTAGANNAKADAGIDMAADAAISSGIPIAMVIGAAVKGVGIASKALVKTPKAIRDFTVNQNVQNSSAFGGVKSSADAMASRANEIKGQSYSRLWSGGWSKDKAAANQAMYLQNSADSLLQNEKKNNENALSQLDTLSNKVNLQNNGFDLRNMRFGQRGMKIAPKIFKKGGSINVIVNGKLHKELHDVKDNPDFEDAKLTRKGVPVITLEEGGEVKQHAEVERDEIIFRLEVTQKLEGLMELGDEEAMIEAGKLLAYEIVKNTKDSKSKIIKNA